MRNGLLSRLIGGTLLILVFAAGVAQAIDTPDAWVTMKTKIALMTTEGVSTTGLNVDTVKGVVLLSGKTKSLEAYLESVEVANAVRGVRRVSTEVEVVPAS
jgi:osmotically-inducible protein OsmY